MTIDEDLGAVVACSSSTARRAPSDTSIGLPNDWLQNRIDLRTRFADARPSDDALALAARARDFAANHVIHGFEYRGLRLLLDPVTGLTLKCDADTLQVVVAIACRSSQPVLAALLEQVGLERGRLILDELTRMTHMVRERFDACMMEGNRNLLAFIESFDERASQRTRR